MTVSTDGQICYGILFDEDFKFPWDDGYDGIDDWWVMGARGFKPSVEIYDEAGEYLNGVRPSDAVYDAYWKERHEFEAAFPCPVSLVNACSHKYPIWILTVEATEKRAHRGFPVTFVPTELVATDAMREALLNFCKEYHIDIGDKTPQWWLSSYWG